MTTTLLDYAVGNTLLALPVALIAWWIGRTQRYPSVTHLLWALVLVRLLLPPITAVPCLSLRMPWGGPTATWLVADNSPLENLPQSPFRVARELSNSDFSFENSEVTVSPSRVVAEDPEAQHRLTAIERREQESPRATLIPRDNHEVASDSHDPRLARGLPSGSFVLEGPSFQPNPELFRSATLGLVTTWLGGSLVIAILSIWRIQRFRRWLQRATIPVPSELQCMANDVASELGKPLTAELLLSRAKLPPFVWWLGRRPQIVLPQKIMESLPPIEQRLVIAHELAHVHRKDYLMRWLEWIAITWLWWNPLAWLARRELRTSEELACDALVLQGLKPEPSDYGSCLLSVAEALLSTRVDAPMLACTMSAGQSLEQRLTMIMSSHWIARPSIFLGCLVMTLAMFTFLLNIASGENNLPRESRDELAERQSAIGETTAPATAAPATAVSQPAANQQTATSAVEPETKASALEAETSPNKRFVSIEKTVDSVKRLNIGSFGTSIRVLRDDTAGSVRIRAELEPISDEISDAQFAYDVEGMEIFVTQLDEGEVDLTLSIPLFVLQVKNILSSMNADHGVRERIQATLTVLVPRLDALTVGSLSGNLFIEGDVGDLNLNTVSGDIEVREAIESVELNTVSGALRVSMADSSQGNIEARSLSGDVILSLPGQWRGTIDANTTFGRVALEGMKDTRKRKRARSNYAGVIGQGKASVADLNSFSGMIQVQRR